EEPARAPRRRSPARSKGSGENPSSGQRTDEGDTATPRRVARLPDARVPAPLTGGEGRRGGIYQEEGRRTSGTKRRGNVMAEPTNNSSAHREQVEAALDDAVQQQANLERAIRLQFAQGWQSRGELDALPLE